LDWQLSNRQTNFGLRVATATATADAAAASELCASSEWTNFYAEPESPKLSVGQGASVAAFDY